MKCQTSLLKKFLGLKGAVYCEAIAMVIFSHVKITCYSGRLRPGSKSLMIFMYSFQKLWLKTSTWDDFW